LSGRPSTDPVARFQFFESLWVHGVRCVDASKVDQPKFVLQIHYTKLIVNASQEFCVRLVIST